MDEKMLAKERNYQLHEFCKLSNWLDKQWNTKSNIHITIIVWLSPWEANKRSVSLVGSIWLTLLYYIRIWILSAEIIFLFWWWRVGGGRWATFWFFKSLDNNMIYSSGIYIFVYKRNPCRTKVLWVLKFGEVGTCVTKNQNTNIHVFFIFWV